MSSRIDLDLNRRITRPSGSSTIWSMSLLSICAGGTQFEISSSSGREISSHLSSFGVKTVVLSSSTCNKTISWEFEGRGLRYRGF